jgi:hypothetical protein
MYVNVTYTSHDKIEIKSLWFNSTKDCFECSVTTTNFSSDFYGDKELTFVRGYFFSSARDTMSWPRVNMVTRN